MEVFRSVQELADALFVDIHWLRKLARRADDLYSQGYTYKKNGRRRIYWDPHPVLKEAQREIYLLIFGGVLPESPIAFLDPIEALRPHERPDWFLKLDIVDFFPSVRARLIAESSFGNWEGEALDLMLKIVTRRGRLVQGAPTSPVISNWVLQELDHELYAAAEACDARMSRFADDHFVSAWTRRSAIELAEAAQDAHSRFSLRLRRSNPLPRRVPQTAMGLTLNNGLAIPRSQRAQIRSRIRAIIRQSIRGERLSYSAASEIGGLISWVRRLHPQEADRLQKMASALLYGPVELQ